MIDKLAELNRRYEEIGEQMADPATVLDMKKFVKLKIGRAHV